MTAVTISAENTLGPYRLVRKLGEGGMGTVYLAYDSQLARHVAIKVLRIDPERAASATASLAKRFLREAQAAAQLNHPNVVTIHTVGGGAPGDTGGRPFLVMEHVDGGSLADELRRTGPLSWRASAAAVRDALLALAAAHHAGIIHRDIKPANLMRMGEAQAGLVKLVDFGLARAVYAPMEAEITFPGAFVGSPSYASPEQIAGVVRLDARSDLYSLAATWYALLTGQPPFVDDDPQEIMRGHSTEPFPDVRELAVDVPDEVVAIIKRASEKQPRDRYAGAAEMRAAVEQAMQLSERAAIVPPHRASASPRRPKRVEETVADLESQLAVARQASDSGTQLATLRTLYGVYSQLDRREQALSAYRQAIVLHVKIHQPRARM